LLEIAGFLEHRLELADLLFGTNECSSIHRCEKVAADFQRHRLELADLLFGTNGRHRFTVCEKVTTVFETPFETNGDDECKKIAAVFGDTVCNRHIFVQIKVSADFETLIVTNGGSSIHCYRRFIDSPFANKRSSSF